MTVKAEIQEYDDRGHPCGSGQLFLPDYLDWLPIDVKAFWYTERGYGNPKASQVLFISQGERRLITIEKPLQLCDYKHLQEIDNELYHKVDRFIQENGHSRKPRNQ